MYQVLPVLLISAILRVVLDFVYPGDMLNSLLVTLNWPVVLSVLIHKNNPFCF